MQSKAIRPFKIEASLLIVLAPFHEDICQILRRGAIAAAEESEAQWLEICVPGALELPAAISIAHSSGRYDAYVALGCVLRGETSHYDIVAQESARGLMNLSLQGLAIGNGILTCDTHLQAKVRAEDMDKGGEAVWTALTMVNVTRRLHD